MKERVRTYKFQEGYYYLVWRRGTLLSELCLKWEGSACNMSKRVAEQLLSMEMCL